MLLEAKKIYKSYGKVKVLKGVSLYLNKGEIVALVGPSGAGKTTLLHILGTLEKPDKGAVYFEDQEISHQQDTLQARLRNQHLGFVFQFHYLLPEFTALENVLLPILLYRSITLQDKRRAQLLLERFGLGDRLHHRPSALSGGEQQRVALARALINQPKLLLADEPTGNLDSQNTQMLFEYLRNLVREEGVTVLMATHKEYLAQQADRVLRIQDGLLQSP